MRQMLWPNFGAVKGNLITRLWQYYTVLSPWSKSGC